MADLILNINFDESKKKNRLVIETYEGKIPKLKSKQYSGQLRNVNINQLEEIDNLSAFELNQIKEILNDNSNMQISKYQYIIAVKNLYNLVALLSYSCLFYKADRKSPMYQVEKIDYFLPDATTKMCKIDNFYFCGEKTQLYFQINENSTMEDVCLIETEVYINLLEKNYPLDLFFDYKDFKFKYNSIEKTIQSNKIYRDYAFEHNILDYIEESNWHYKRGEYFYYIGQELNVDIEKLNSKGIKIYTNTGKKIASSDFSNLHITYNIDWFEIKGNIKFNDQAVNISEIMNLKNRRKNWVEYNENVILLPDVFSKKNIKFDNKSNKVFIDKKNIIDAVLLADSINKSTVDNIEKYFDYNNVQINIDKKIHQLLRPYQLIGVKWLTTLKRNSVGGCLADDMGLGKTIQIIAFISDDILNKGTSLIIVPKTLLLNWERELDRFLPNVPYYIYHGTNREIDILKEYRIIISTYGTILNDIMKFKNKYFENLIVDEAQYIKNSRSKAYRALINLKANTRYILTGTPIENNLKEYWGLMRFINPQIMRLPYSAIYKELSGNENIEKIKSITAPFVLRRTKDKVLNDLPDKQEQILYCNMESEQQELYDNMLKSLRYEMLRENNRFEIKDNSIMLNGLLYLQQICCHPQILNKDLNEKQCMQSAKFELLIDLLKKLYISRHKVIIFSRFTKMLKLIEKQLVYLHFTYFYLDGNTRNRMEIVDDFENSQMGVFLISLKAGGTGINLVSADTAIIYDPWWNPAVEKQAEDRIYRIGQKNNVIIYRLIVANTIEDKIQKLQQEKTLLYSQILEGLDTPTSMTAEIMEKLILE